MDPNRYNPISDLEKQYGDKPLGRRLMFVVSVSPGCLVPGGVETVLKAKSGGSSSIGNKHSSGSSSKEDLMGLAVENSLSEEFSSGVDIYNDNNEDVYNTQNISNDVDYNNDESSDAFGFLNESSSNNGNTKTSTSGGGKSKLSGFKSAMSKIAKSTQHTLDRTVTSMAAKAAKHNKEDHGDYLTIAAYTLNPHTGVHDTCIGITEPLSTLSFDEIHGATFRIPLNIPPKLYEHTRIDPTTHVLLRLWIRSGAPFLARNRAFHKHFVVGDAKVPLALLDVPKILSGVPLQIAFPLITHVLTPEANANLGITIMTDAKFPPLCGNGWTLADPRLDTAYTPTVTRGPLFQPTLDQTYVYDNSTKNTGQQPSPHKYVLLATERTTESTLVLPLALAYANLLNKAYQISVQHASKLTAGLKCFKSDEDDSNKNKKNKKNSKDHNPCNDEHNCMKKAHARCNISLSYFARNGAQYSGNGGDMGANRINVTVNLERPDCIFENCLASGSVPRYVTADPSLTYPNNVTMRVPFYPRIIRANDRHVIPGLTSIVPSSNNGMLLGRVRFELREDGFGDAGTDVFHPIGPAANVGTLPDTLSGSIDLEPYLDLPNSTTATDEKQDFGTPVMVPITDMRTGQNAGVLSITISVKSNVDNPKFHTSTPSNSSSSSLDELLSLTGGDDLPVDGGLISLVGMDTLLEGDLACRPHLDLEASSQSYAIPNPKTPLPPEDSTISNRRKQIELMGEFLTSYYLNHYESPRRTFDASNLAERCKLYHNALYSNANGANPPPSDQIETITPDKRKDPRPFRPSSTRMDEDLSGIGFNVHVQNLALSSITVTTQPTISNKTITCVPTTNTPIALFQNVTCGAPADHFRGFDGNDHSGYEPNGPNSKKQNNSRPKGGLRRLQASRILAVQKFRDKQQELIQEVMKVFQCGAGSGPNKRYINASNGIVTNARYAAVEACQELTSLTWDIAVRRGNCFSQALGIGVTLYLAMMSDMVAMAKHDWASVWKQHGFLVTFEGLLSTAGKELGMIEDAAIGIQMLRMASVVMVPDDTTIPIPTTYDESSIDSKVPVIDSPYVKWVNIIPSGVGSATQYLVQIGIEKAYYEQRVPIPLRDGATVRFFPVLYQMGVDIRQWGHNIGIKNSNHKDAPQDDVDDDEIGIPDNDVLIALNYEAFRKTNAYAHAIAPNSSSPPIEKVTWEVANNDEQLKQPVHHYLTSLYESIRASAGKMEHGVPDNAATACARLGGGGAIFCKSGKDRTAMQVTFKQAQYVHRFMGRVGDPSKDEEHWYLQYDKLDDANKRKVFEDASLMRMRGTRLPICDKNVGQALYAFNSLQAKFMPDALKPPSKALAGFLKGGRVFSREGGIES